MKRSLTLALITTLLVAEARPPAQVVAELYLHAGSFTIAQAGKERKGQCLEYIVVGQIIKVQPGGKVIIRLKKTDVRYAVLGGSEVRVTANELISIRGEKPRELGASRIAGPILSNMNGPRRVTATSARAPFGNIGPRGSIVSDTAELKWDPILDAISYTITARNETTGAELILSQRSATEACTFTLKSASLPGKNWWRITIASRRSADADPEIIATYVRFMDREERALFMAAEAELLDWEEGLSRTIALARLYRRFDLIDLAKEQIRKALELARDDPYLKEELRQLQRWPEDAEAQ